MMKTFVLAAALAFSAHVSAQGTGSTPAKKELVAKILQMQQPAVEQLARQLVEAPAAQMLQRAGSFVQARVEPEKREAMARDLQADARKYVDETYPFVRERALSLAPTTVGAVLEEKLSEAELRDVVKILEMPSWNKFQSLGGEMQKALGEKLVADVKSQLEPKVRALDQAMAGRLGIKAGAASAAGTGK